MFELDNFAIIKTIHPFEWVMLGIYCILIFGITFARQVYKIEKQPVYRFFTWAVFAKIVSSIIFCFIYIYYYHGGDTVSYYETSRALVNLGVKDIGKYIDFYFSDIPDGSYPNSFDSLSSFTFYLY
jgi:hypothetical protein